MPLLGKSVNVTRCNVAVPAQGPDFGKGGRKMSETGTVADLKDLRPYRVRLSVVYDVLVLGSSELQMWDNLFPWIAEILRVEEPIAEGPEIISVAESDLSELPERWGEDSYLYGPLGEVSVREVRKALAEREVASLVVGTMVYHRYVDLFGRIESIIPMGSGVESLAMVKYEYPMSPDAEPREVRLRDLIAAEKADRWR